MEALFESLPFKENQLYERIISDLTTQKYSIVDDFFTIEEALELRHSLEAKLQANLFKTSAIGNKTNEIVKKQVRGDIISWIDEQNKTAEEAQFFSKINSLITYLNKTCFLGILSKEFHYAIYPKGTHYLRHVDTFMNDDRRKLSMVCYLNKEHWTDDLGGHLVLYLKHQELKIAPQLGRLVIFESQEIAHEVTTVNTERYSITGWLKTR